MQELRGWISSTLAASRPAVAAAPRAEQPCPWCGELKLVGSLDPCGHRVCKSCWDTTRYPNCPICHRRVSFVEAAPPSPPLTLVHLGLDPLGMAKERFQRLLSRTAPLSPADREELEAVIDTIGPAAVTWLPQRIGVKQTLAHAIARLWLISPDRSTMVMQTAGRVQNATDVLRVACVLMGGNAELAEPMKLSSIPRGMRRAVLEALELMDTESVVEHVMRHRRLWKRVGEKLHPFEHVDKLPNAAFTFAVLRRTNLSKASFGAELRERAVHTPFVYVEDDIIKPVAWAGPIEDALRAGNPRSALARLTHRPAELLARADHLVRTAQTRQLDALQTMLKAVELASHKGPPATLLTLASHVSRRARPWPRRVFFPSGDLLRGWAMDDTRTPLRGDALAVMVGSIRRQLLARAEQRRQFPRAVIDRALVDLVVPIKQRTISRNRLAWPRGTELALPDGPTLGLAVHGGKACIELFDADWRHVETREASDELHFEKLALAGVRHAVMAVFSPKDCYVQLDALRFDVRDRTRLAVPLTIDLAERRMRWIDVHIKDKAAIEHAGGYRAALAHIGRDFADLVGIHSRPTMWDVACIHAAARANTIYIRERDGSLTIYKRRDNESKPARLGRLMSGAADDGRIAAIPATDAPTWFALVSGLPLPKGSQGYALDASGITVGIELLAAGDLVADLAPIGSRS
jgi:hypothetical protein